MDLLTTAHNWVDAGIAVIPINWHSKRPAADALCLSGDVDEDGRATWLRYQTELPSSETLRRWFTGPRRNIGIVTGWQGLVVVDFDDMAAFDCWAGWATPALQLTYRVLTSRGVHAYFYIAEPVRNGHLGLIDVKAAGGYVLGAGSFHPNGTTYTALESAPIVSVGRLFDVLPFEVEHEPEPAPHVAAPVVSVDPGADPWSIADNPPAVLSSDGAGLVDGILQRVRLEDFFPGPFRGRWQKVRCPFHDDKEPSFWLDLSKQLCGCFAGCTPKALDVIGLYSRLNGISNTAAIHELARRL